MKKRVKENKHDFLCFPYKCYFASDEYKNRKSNSLDVDDERTEYYKTLYKKFFPNEFSHIHLGVRYFPLIPLQLMAQIHKDKDVLKSVAPFFRNPSRKNVPQNPFAEYLPFDYILKEIECFYHVYHSFAFRDHQPYPGQIQALQIDLEDYLRSLELIANEEALDALYDAQRHVGPMFDALATKTVCMGWEASFRKNVAQLRACFERIVRAFYKLESHCYAKIKMPKPEKKKS